MTPLRMGMVMLLAAVLEVGGDALVRFGVRGGWIATDTMMRMALMLGGGTVLLGYAVLVNVVPGGFGRALGVYAAVFLLVAQLIDWLAFGNRPGSNVLLGGVLVAAGGLVMTLR